MPDYYSLGDLAEALRSGMNRQALCTVLVGAGLSVEAGIPTADGIVQTVHDRYPQAFARATAPTYNACMAALSPNERKDLIREYVADSRINWGHVALAALIREGYVDRVLTTNFDDLILRACALAGVFPAVYDLAASSTFIAADVSYPAVFFLHGQATGFTLLNTSQEFTDFGHRSQLVFQDRPERRIWLVVGYSGNNDPVFQNLSAIPRFDERLFWLCHNDKPPSDLVHQMLLSRHEFAAPVYDHDADDFMVKLARELGCFPPEYVGDPFGYLEGLLSQFTVLKEYHSGSGDVCGPTRSIVREAKDRLTPDLFSQIAVAIAAGRSDRAGELAEAVIEQGRDNEQPGIVSWALVLDGNRFGSRALENTSGEADRLFGLARNRYAQALTVNPGSRIPLLNWAINLAHHAERKEGQEADGLFAQAYEKYEQALALYPDDIEIIYAWANSLEQQAQTKDGEEANRLFSRACAKYAEVLALDPLMQGALLNWGVACEHAARKKEGSESDMLLDEARAHYESLLQANPQSHEAMFNTGQALLIKAHGKESAEAIALAEEACGLYEQALVAKPHKHEALAALGCAHLFLSLRVEGNSVDEHLASAVRLFEQALPMRPDRLRAEIQRCLAHALGLQARRAQDSKADLLFGRAQEFLRAAEPGVKEVDAFDFACIAAVCQAPGEVVRRWMQKAREVGVCPAQEEVLAVPHLDAWRDSDWFQSLFGPTE
jgi:tetratricopeptide (TPR) repeat protein